MSAPSPGHFHSCPDLGDLCPTDLGPSHSFSILKMFSADKKRVETALESCGLNFNRVRGLGSAAGPDGCHGGCLLFWGWLPLGSHPALFGPQSESIRPDEFSLEIFERFLNKLCLRPDIDKILLEM